ncbi:glycosyltransferase family 1 protein [Diaminobutyricimonas sp. TR449]|uniref:glycosyltransferase family 4 protein n=1 Tax=Diaminobutyricimonas sp. TR449 TaxID=2708076 RepID=UPI00141E1579|nr:glycosyltransferase family 1 protein [Diaminobutyricimonas sp. TR449]
MTAQDSASVRVLLDATSVPPDEGGVARYLRGLVSGLLGNPDVELHIACQAKDAAWIREMNPDARVHIAPAAVSRRVVRLVWEQVGLPKLARRIGAEVIHAPHYTMPLSSGIPTVVTVHDATFFSHPDVHSRLKGAFFRTWCRVSARSATVLVAPSHATRDEFRTHTGGPRRPFTVAYHGVDRTRFRKPDAAAVANFAARHDVAPGRWIAFLGTIEPRKNVPNLIRAFEQLVASSAQNSDLVLLLAGARGWDDSVDPLIENSPVRTQIRRVGYLEETDLPALLGGALCVAYPSVGEGFGLPVLEAMSCGATVLTTRALALPEVGGDAVAYSGTDAASIAAELQALTEGEPRRQQLAGAALARAEEFTWADSARVHRAAYLYAGGRREHHDGG